MKYYLMDFKKDNSRFMGFKSIFKASFYDSETAKKCWKYGVKKYL